MNSNGSLASDSDPVLLLFAGPEIEVLDEWLDYNGHVTDSAYAVICARANEAFLNYLGLSADYLARTGCSTYTVESHLRYLAEVNRGAVLTSRSQLVHHDTKRLRVHTSVFEGAVEVLSGDYLYLHMDQSASKVAVFPEDRAAALANIKAAHDQVPHPAHLGRGVGAPRG